MLEQSKSAKRRFYDGNFLTKYFVGDGIDIGCGDDSISKYISSFKFINSVKSWDKIDGDAQYLKSINDNSYDFVHSSHSLEHMKDVFISLTNWIRILKSGGYLIITVPDEDLYEHCIWPSQFNSEHLWSFTIYKSNPLLPNSINILDLVKRFSNILICEKIQLINDFYNYSDLKSDQTLNHNSECCIEIIWKKI